MTAFLLGFTSCAALFAVLYRLTRPRTWSAEIEDAYRMRRESGLTP